MCTYVTERIAVEGTAKGPDGWFTPKMASVYFDHPSHAPFDHTLNIDFLDQAAGPSARVAVELSRETALELAQSIFSVIAQADADFERMAQVTVA